MKLICLPYAGGASYIFNNWESKIGNQVKIISPELKGRGARLNSSFYVTLDEAVNDIYDQIKGYISNDKYGILGHSMGSIMAYELYYKIVESGNRIPDFMIFSASLPPNEIKNNKTFELSNDDLTLKLSNMGGSSTEVLHNNDIRRIFFPIIRSDYKLIEEYHYKKRDANITSKSYILYGKNDDIPIELINKWAYFIDNYRIKSFDGNHFFINNNPQLFNYLNSIIEEFN